eukprot:CAMPEP_0185723382 /NCGR_PEP_ID=MMETSP1171-20130828/244_1 /TAXON_ID=374046 /ORGANISM="Helicotheca tamensis, Strain CCMP826" /LENGTH=87 /DNA_ID=CAMNT_0028391079 /DNA_START=682 /DNA_END=942 /DNA_ORIENTATION=-
MVDPSDDEFGEEEARQLLDDIPFLEDAEDKGGEEACASTTVWRGVFVTKAGKEKAGEDGGSKSARGNNRPRRNRYDVGDIDNFTELL